MVNKQTLFDKPLDVVPPTKITAKVLGTRLHSISRGTKISDFSVVAFGTRTASHLRKFMKITPSLKIWQSTSNLVQRL